MKFLTRSLAVVALAVSVPLVAIAQQAEAPRTGPASEASPLFRRHHAMGGIMKQMVDEMQRMQGDMANLDKLPPESRKQMAQDMKRMAAMMNRMSGLADRPTMSEPEAKKQLDEMRRDMDAMSRSHARAF